MNLKESAEMIGKHTLLDSCGFILYLHRETLNVKLPKGTFIIQNNPSEV